MPRPILPQEVIDGLLHDSNFAEARVQFPGVELDSLPADVQLYTIGGTLLSYHPDAGIWEIWTDPYWCQLNRTPGETPGLQPQEPS